MADELLYQLATKLFNKSEDEIKKLLLNENGEPLENGIENIIALDNARIKRIKGENHDAGYGKAKKETASEIEKFYREKFGINTDGNYEAIAEAISEQIASSSTKGKQITDDDVKKHPAYLKLEKEYVPKSKYEELDNQFNQFKTGIDRRIKFDKVKERALVELENMKPDYPDVPQIKQNLVNAFIKEIESFEDFEFVENEIVAIKDGKRVDDGRGNPTTFEQIVKEKAAGYFKFLESDAKGNAGNKNNGVQSNPPAGKYVFKTKEEAVNAYEKAKAEGASQEELKKIIDAANAVRS